MTPDDWLRKYAGVPEKIDLGLERCQQVLKLLDLVPAPFKIITVAGTNGKGSTVAILDAILSHSGLLTGRYSSPHLIRFNERILIGQKEVTTQEIIASFDTIRTIANGINLSYFEYATIAGLLLFAQAQIDIALLEVGLGGRLDACNAIDPDIGIITSISLDHQDWLGDDLSVIAYEKAGIARPNKPLILASKNLPQSINAYADEIGARIIQCEQDYQFEIHSKTEKKSWIWKDEINQLELTPPSLNGDIQIQNSASAIAALTQCDFWPLSTTQITQGLQSIRLSGRLQTITKQKRNWLLDVAHNPASMQILCDSLQNYKYQQEKISVVFAMLADKDVHGCIKLLSPFVKFWHITTLNSPRSLSCSRLESILLECGVEKKNIQIANSVAKACSKVHANTQADEQILVCGSFYTVGDALSYLDSV